ncbi:hypothetical protein [Psychrobacter sp. W2-37-MNA-CIBAN-0211]|uniref:hypothetical protein n=1 Tax=Psychrobacter sp. W2-37-MNA-CIBAN-0211 TaxID=3140443 RepID=UPI00332C68D0
MSTDDQTAQKQSIKDKVMAKVKEAITPAPKPKVNPNLIAIDSRAATYDGEPIRVMAVTASDTGKILVSKQKEWRDPVEPAGNTTVVTDTPNTFNHWSLSFDEGTQMKEVMAAYKASLAAGLLSLDDSLRRYDPAGVIQTRKVDERGKSLDFDSMGMNNGHIAILLAIWAAQKSHGGYIITLPPDQSSEDEDESDGEFDMLPFSV